MTVTFINTMSDPYSAVTDTIIEQMTRETVNARGLLNEAFTQGRSCDAYDGGFSPYWDAGTLHFHQQIAEAIRGIGSFARSRFTAHSSIPE